MNQTAIPPGNLLEESQVIGWRRDFHQYPETGWTEFRTTARLAELLSPIAELTPGREFLHRAYLYDRQLDVTREQQRAVAAGAAPRWIDWMGPLPGLMATIDSGTPGPVMALRIDLDGLALQEAAERDHLPHQAGFGSSREGFMHGCAHDGHMAVGLAVAHLLHQNRRQWRGTFVLIAQPAEEGCRGGRAIAESGALDRVDALFGFHLGMGIPSGTLVVSPDQFFSTSKFDVTFTGLAAHASLAPQDGRNALAAACFAVNQLLAIPRHSEGATRLNIGTLSAGSSRNIVPAHAHMRAETRGSSDALNTYLMNAVKRIVDGTAMAHGVESKLQIVGESCNVHQSAQLAQLALSVAASEHWFGRIETCAPFGASEDASWLMSRVQEQGGEALYQIIGANLVQGHHCARFDFDERVLWPAANYLTRLIMARSQRTT